MKPTPLESSVTQRIVKYLKAQGAWQIKSTGVSLVGCPDIICCYQGRFVALEVKREKDGKYGATSKQLHEIDRIRRAGGIAEVVSSVDEVAVLIDALGEQPVAS
jgi:Holliday junction resolvase